MRNSQAPRPLAAFQAVLPRGLRSKIQVRRKRDEQTRRMPSGAANDCSNDFWTPEGKRRSGRSLCPRVTTLTTATMIAPDASNRAQVITMETNDEALGLELRRLGKDMLTATGEIGVQTTGKVHMRVRLVTTITV